MMTPSGIPGAVIEFGRMAMAGTPLLLVHGAWHGSWCWGRLSVALGEAGFETYTVDLPSHGEDTSTLGGLHEDATIIREALSGLPDRTVVVAHSYGGAPVAEGAADAPNVGHLVYLTAFMLDEGESVLGAAGGTATAVLGGDTRRAGMDRTESGSRLL